MKAHAEEAFRCFLGVEIVTPGPPTRCWAESIDNTRLDCKNAFELD
jgi:hypothetical protein